MILWGPAGTGKTTLAHLLADAVGREFTSSPRSTRGVADARKVMDGAKGGLFRTVLFVDEVHRWSKAQQDVLLPAVEEGTVTLIGATTENPYFSLNTPLLSRCLLLRLEPLAPEDAARAAPPRARRRGPRARPHGLEIDDDALAHLVDGRRRRRPDRADRAWRRRPWRRRPPARRRSRSTSVSDAVQKTAVVYDRQGDAHYDVISAFIKSIRGSDPDAALFWLARMVEAGEDAAFIARRLIVHASEDVGMADTARAARRGRGRPGRRARGAARGEAQPRARHDLPRARPEVEQRDRGIGAAKQDAVSADPVPTHLRDASYPGAKRLGHGKGYVYPHDRPGH